MGKENIHFLTAWIILGNVFATFSTDPEPTAISNSTGSPTEFGKSGTSTPTSLSSLLPLQEIMRRTHTDLRLIAERCFALTENNPARRVHIYLFFPLSACRPASHFMPYVQRLAQVFCLQNWTFLFKLHGAPFSRERNGNNRSVFVYLESDKFNFKSHSFLPLLERKPRHS